MNSSERLAHLREEVRKNIIEFEKLAMCERTISREEALENWKNRIWDAITTLNLPNIRIQFDFTLHELPINLKRRYLWLGVHDEGIQGWDNDLIGIDFKDAIIRSIYKNPYAGTMCWDFIDMMDQNYPGYDLSKPIGLEIVENIADQIIKYIKNSEVDGDSSEQIIVFDITYPKEVKLLYPEKQNNTVLEENTNIHSHPQIY
jgi:hypothetical protein